jgi:hypothetical protein
MKIKLHHLPSNTVIESDEFGVDTVDEIYDLMVKASAGKLEYLQLHCGGNLTFIPSKILDESIITIIEE